MSKTHEYVVGHNPVGGWMVLALLLLLAARRCLVCSATTRSPPPARWRATSATKPPIKLMSRHRLIGDLLLIMVGVHIAAVLFHLFVKKKTTVRAMFSGRKELPARARPRGRSLTQGVNAARIHPAFNPRLLPWQSLSA